MINVRKCDQIKRLEQECQFLRDKKYAAEIIDIFENRREIIVNDIFKFRVFQSYPFKSPDISIKYNEKLYDYKDICVDLLLRYNSLTYTQSEMKIIFDNWCNNWCVTNKIIDIIESVENFYNSLPKPLVKSVLSHSSINGGGGGGGQEDKKYLQPTPLMREHGIGFAGYNEKGIPKYIIGLCSNYDIRIEGDITNMTDQDIVSLWTKKNFDAFRKDQIRLTDTELQTMK